MSITRMTRLFTIGVGCCASLAATSIAQTGPGPSKTVEIPAREIGKGFAAGKGEFADVDSGKVLRIAGRVSVAHEPFLYLGTDSTFPNGRPIEVAVEFPARSIPRVSSGDQVVVEGRFAGKGSHGPILSEGRFIRQELGRKVPSSVPSAAVAAPTRPSVKKGRASMKPEARAEGPAAAIDPKAVVLRFDGPIKKGEAGYLADHTSFRLRFGPGTQRGTAVGPSIAWGDGNQGHDYWGVGSGEPTVSSEVREDGSGAYFVFSLKGDDWESSRVAALFRLTFPDGRHGVATAVIPVDKAP